MIKILINKDNAIEQVTELLKRLKLAFTYEDNVFDIIVGSESCYIQVEYGEAEGDEVIMQFYDNPEKSTYEEYDTITDIDSVEDCVTQMVEFVKGKIKKIAKIKHHIDCINSIAEDMDLEPEFFIDVTYDFSEYE